MFQTLSSPSDEYILVKRNEIVQNAKFKMDRCVSDLRGWLLENGLLCNDDKTDVMCITSQFKSPLQFPELQIGDSLVTPSSSIKNLGVIIDDHIKMDKQVNSVTSSAFFHLRKVGKIRLFLNMEAAKALVYARVTSKLDYCNSLLYGLPEVLINKLQYVQNTAARVITKTKKYDHITHVLAELHWLCVPQRHIFKIALLTFKCLNGLAPKYLADLIQPYSSRAGLRSENKGLLFVPKSRTKTYGDRAFSHSSPKIWNSLPLNIRLCESLPRFKKLLKSHLYKLSYAKLKPAKL